jgi:hypothetical protein
LDKERGQKNTEEGKRSGAAIARRNG